jgi:hypothetical protein
MANKQAHVFDKSYIEANKTEGFSSENKYRRERDEQYTKLEAELKNKPIESKEGDPTDAPAGEEDAGWKKRYGDLRSHAAKKEQELRNLIASLETEVKTAKTKDAAPKYPKTEEELREWVSMYPDVAAMIETIAGRTSEKVKQEISQDIAVLNDQKAKLEFQRAYGQLLGMHPDFDEIRVTEDFNEWMSEQPELLQRAIYEPGLDDAGVKSAARVIDLYKRDKGLDKKKTPKSPNVADAARVNARSNRSAPDSENDGAPKFSESVVAKLSSKDFERLWPQIQAAQRNGTFDYDITGAAR